MYEGGDKDAYRTEREKPPPGELSESRKRYAPLVGNVISTSSACVRLILPWYHLRVTEC